MRTTYQEWSRAILAKWLRPVRAGIRTRGNRRALSVIFRSIRGTRYPVVAGTVKLVGTDAERIIAETRYLLDDWGEYRRMAQAVSPYGDGRAAERISDILLGKQTAQNAEVVQSVRA